MIKIFFKRGTLNEMPGSHENAQLSNRGRPGSGLSLSVLGKYTFFESNILINLWQGNSIKVQVLSNILYSLIYPKNYCS